MFQAKFAEKIIAHILCSTTFFWKSCHLWDMWKNIVEPDRPQIMTRAYCMLDTQGYEHALRICNSYCFFTATMVERMRLIVPLYAHCLSCLMFPAIFYSVWLLSSGLVRCKQPHSSLTMYCDTILHDKKYLILDCNIFLSIVQIQRSRVRFPALPDFLSSSGSGTGSTQPCEVNWGATWIKKSSGSGPENRD